MFSLKRTRRVYGVSLQTEHLKLNVKHRDGPLQRSEQFVPLIIALQLGSPRQWPK